MPLRVFGIFFFNEGLELLISSVRLSTIDRARSCSYARRDTRKIPEYQRPTRDLSSSGTYYNNKIDMHKTNLKRWNHTGNATKLKISQYVTVRNSSSHARKLN